jgi:hypothetical protein
LASIKKVTKKCFKKEGREENEYEAVKKIV